MTQTKVWGMELTTVPAARRALLRLARDLRPTFAHHPDEIWGRLDADLWRATHNRWVVAAAASDAAIAHLIGDPDGRRRLERLVTARDDEGRRSTWFDGLEQRAGFAVAYFSMEYMLSESLPIYSGGLGNVAGDQLKAASDLGVPVTGIGLLYQQGYFQQIIGEDGQQVALHPFNDPGQMPVEPVRDATGGILRMSVKISTDDVVVRAWRATVGRCELILLDTNDYANPGYRRTITSELYGGGIKVRLAQEIVLGIGGAQVLQHLGIDPSVVHLNEGHAALVVLERARQRVAATGCHLGDALEDLRTGTLFTTHTPVAAGFDQFDVSLVERYLGRYATEDLGISPQELVELGRVDGGSFMPSALAVRASGAVNGVSELHGLVSRSIIGGAFPRTPPEEVPVGSVTNGIHMDTWTSPAASELWDSVLPVRFDGRSEPSDVERAVDALEDAAIWAMRRRSRAELCDFVVERSTRELVESPLPDGSAAVLDPEILTIGFARRFATYKRAHLLLRDPERLARLLLNAEQPVQLLVAGKAHPADAAGRLLLQRWVAFARRTDLSGRVAFLTDYDMLVTRELIGGVDVWLNTPLKPHEASGTSGMKALPNGGLNVGVADGWWAEVDHSTVGWVIGEGVDDRTDAEDLYRILEQEVVPLFYERNDADIPSRWLSRVRSSLKLTAQYSADRTVRQYTERYYLPLADAWRPDGDDQHDRRDRVRRIAAGWSSVRIHSVGFDRGDGCDIVSVHVTPGALLVEDLIVELVAIPHEVVPMTPVSGSDPFGGIRYEALLSRGSDADRFTPRVRARVDRTWLNAASHLVAWAG